jgi:hypothetical protein
MPTPGLHIVTSCNIKVNRRNCAKVRRREVRLGSANRTGGTGPVSTGGACAPDGQNCTRKGHQRPSPSRMETIALRSTPLV